MRLLILAAALAAAPAFADSEAHQGADWVRFTTKACTDEKVLEQLKANNEDPMDYHAAVAEFQGQSFVACWRPDYRLRSFMLRYEDGDSGLVPFDHAKRVQDT